MPLKTCSLCKKDKDLEAEFHKKNSSKNSYQPLCKECNSERGKIHYQNNKDKIKSRTKERKNKLQPLAKELIIKLLRNGCVDCKEKDIIVLDFDHLYDKKYSISRMINGGYTEEQILEETSKCVVRCANCHRRKTAKDFDWWRNNL